MTKSEAIILLKEGQYLERYPTEKVFHVCADGNVFLQDNTSDARAHATGKGIELVTLSVAAVLADETPEETEAEKVERLAKEAAEKLADEEAKKAEAEKLATEEAGKAEALELLKVTEESEELLTAILEISAEGIAAVTELEPEVTEVKEEIKPSKKAK